MARIVALSGWRFVSGFFRGLARQRDEEAARIVQYYRQDRWSDSLEKDIERVSTRSGNSIYQVRHN